MSLDGLGIILRPISAQTLRSVTWAPLAVFVWRHLLVAVPIVSQFLLHFRKKFTLKQKELEKDTIELGSG